MVDKRKVKKVLVYPLKIIYKLYLPFKYYFYLKFRSINYIDKKLKKIFHGTHYTSDSFAGFSDDANKDFFISSLKNKEILLSQAGNFCKHIFNLLGSGEVKLKYNSDSKLDDSVLYKMNLGKNEIRKIKINLKKKVGLLFENLKDKDSFNNLKSYNYEPIDWHKDFKSGYRWNNNLLYKNIKFGNIEGVDVKIPWELSRCYHFITLGQAYFITGDERYAEEFIYQSIDWVENNPFQFGVNWSCTMDTAIRACNWIAGFSLLRTPKLLNMDFIYYFYKSLLAHGMHIIHNLEKNYFMTATNHYISNLTGIFYLGIIFQNTGFGKKWINFAVKELKNQMERQVYNDGCDFEASTCYHRLVLELFFFPVLFFIKNKQDLKIEDYVNFCKEFFGSKFIDKLYRMFEAVLYLLKPNGQLPQIGDNDSGRLHIYSHSNSLDCRYLLNIGVIFFNESKFKIRDFGLTDEVMWIFGHESQKKWSNLQYLELSNINSKSFDNSGWYIMRNNNNYLLASCGPNGQNGDGGHAHNDKLSFELFLNNIDVVIDPGTYTYTPYPKERNLFRSTNYHNTVIADNTEQNRFDERNLFFMENDARVKVNKWITNEEYDLIDAEHNGYLRLKDPVNHRRKIYFNKSDSFIVIKDILTGKGSYTFDIYYHLGKDISCSIEKNLYHIFHNNCKIMNLFVFSDTEVEKSTGNYFYSEGYGIKTNSEFLKFSFEAGVPAGLTFFLYNIDFEKKFNILSSSQDLKNYIKNLINKTGL
ncbi:MAG: hypothetical protein FJW56_01540 [Actinobacteria bacterium]|nr:hypothetical protein [Actinomycetota bacterium]